jgi:hypothetical protein
VENLEEKAVDRLHKPQKVISSPISIRASRDASSSESANRWSPTTAH